MITRQFWWVCLSFHSLQWRPFSPGSIQVFEECSDTSPCPHPTFLQAEEAHLPSPLLGGEVLHGDPSLNLLQFISIFLALRIQHWMPYSRFKSCGKICLLQFTDYTCIDAAQYAIIFHCFQGALLNHLTSSWNLCLSCYKKRIFY